MKRLCKLLTILAFCVLLCALAFTAHAETASGTAGDLTWSISGSALTISGEGIIPNYSGGGAPWYPYRESISRIVIGDGVTSIGEYAFANMTTPGRITLGKDILSIGSYAFSGCSSLTRVTLPDGLLSIGIGAFQRCSSLGGITIPNSVTTMGNSAFYDCDALGTVTIGNGLKAVSQYAFYDCDALSTLVIGDGVTNIGQYAFASCGSLSNVTIGRGVTTIGFEAFGGLYGYSTYKYIDDYRYYYSQYGCASLTSIVIPDSVTSIGERAFSGSGLVNVTMGEGVTNIGAGAFAECAALASVAMGDGLTSIGSAAFAGCASLSKIKIPDNVTSIGEGAFAGCGGLTTVKLGENIVKLGSYAFTNCSVLKTILVNEWISTVESYAFNGCAVLSDVYFAGTEEDRAYISIKTGNSAFTNAAWHYGEEPGHTLELVEGVEATCTEPGNIAYYRCTDCGQLFSDENGTTRISASDVVIPALGHDCGAWEVTKEATIEYPGEKTRACARCGMIETQIIPIPDIESYTVTYNANSGESAPEAQVKLQGKILTLSSTVPTKSGYTFRSWNDLSDGSGIAYAPGDAYEYDANITLYAQWISNDRILNLPAMLTAVESEAFINIDADAVRIPGKVTSIATDAFDADIVIIAGRDSYAAQWAADYGMECVTE